MESQNKQILSHLRSQTITAFEALQLYGCLRLAARIKDLREGGNEINTVMVEVANGKRIAEYTLIKEAGV